MGVQAKVDPLSQLAPPGGMVRRLQTLQATAFPILPSAPGPLFHITSIANVTLTHKEVVVTYPRSAKKPYFMKATYHGQCQAMPWLGNETLKL